MVMVKSYHLKTLKGLFTLFLLVLLISEANAQNEVAIGSTTTKSNAILWLNGNGSQGLILPIVSNKTAVSAEKGMIVYDNSDNKVWYRNDNAWVEVGGGSTVVDNDKLSLQIQGNQLQLLDGTKIQSTVNIAGGTATSGAFMIWTGTSWQYTTLSDVSGATGQVTGIKGKPVPNLPTTTQALVYDGSAWTFQTLTGSDSQTLTFTSPNLSISNGNSVNLSALDKDAQTLTLTGSNLSISGGNSVTLPSSTGVTSVTAGTGLTGGTITTTGTINVDVGTIANKIVQLDATGKLPAVDGSQLTNLPPIVEIGDISDVITTPPLTGGGSSGSVTIGLATSGITPGIYGSATAVPQMTIDAFGRITAVTTFPPLVADGSVTGGTAGTGVKIAANTITDANILSLNASKITAGTLPVAQVPSLDASKITTGTFNASQIPNLDASKITTGTFNTAQIPNLDAAKITSGIIPTSQGGTGLNLSGGSIGNGQLLIGNGAGFAKANLTAGSGVNITNGAGTITISSTASAETDPVVTAINGIVKSNGTTLSAATAGTDYVAPNAAITGATATKITYDAKGLVTAGAPLVAGDIPNIAESQVTNLVTDLAGKQPQLSGTGFVKASGTTITYDNSTYLTSFTETDPAVKAINGIVKSNGTTLSAASAGTDYVAPNAAITGATATKITYDAKGLVTAGATLVAGDIPTIAQSQVTNLVTDLAGKQTQLNGTGIVRAAGTTITYDNATYLSTETDPAVTAINGIVKSNGTTLSAAAAGTDYVAPNAAITGATATKITYDAKGLVTAGSALLAADIPNLDASKITTGTLSIANGGTGAATAAGALTSLGALGTASTAGGDLSGTFSNLQLVAGTVVDADVNAAAAIAGTKISPDFGAQNILTTGTLTTGNSTTFGTATTTWPAANASGVLTNDGTGALTWAASGGSGWSLTGNGLTTPGTNFIGTTDVQDLVFKTNNTERLRIKSGGYISTLTNPYAPATTVPELELYQGGAESNQVRLLGVPTQLQTVQLFGQNAGTGAVQGWAILRAADETLIMTNNAGAGVNSLTSTHAMIISANGNTLLGPNGPANSKLDIEGNLAVGATYAGSGGTAAPANGAIIQGNVGIGTNAPSTNLHVVGSIRMVDGNQANGRVLTSDANGVASWQAAGAGSGWTLTGNAGTNATTNFIGTTDLVRFNFRVNNQNAGRIDLLNTDGGTESVSLGLSALNAITTGQRNIAIGNKALEALTASPDNVAIGRSALLGLGTTNTIGSNTAIGSQTLVQNTTGYRNTAIGYLAGSTTANPDVVGPGITTGNNNIFIGAIAGPTVGNLTNATAIGANVKVGASNTMIFGNSSVVGWGFGAQPASCCDAILVGTGPTNGNGATLGLTGTWNDVSDSTKKYNVNSIQYGLEEIMKLRPVNYQWKGTGEKDLGFLAQQVKAVLPEIVHGEDGNMTLTYSHITAVLTKAMQEQQQQIETLKALLQEKDNKVNSLEDSVTAMKNELEEIKRALGMEAKAPSKDKKVNE
jgi:hypothetical protein